jgi:hypothetical protein
MALTLPKLSLPKPTLSKKQILATVVGVVILSAAGWFGWQYFEDAGPAPAAPSKPQPVTAAKPPGAGKAAAPADAGPARDKLIQDLLVASGLKQQLNQLPQKLMTGVRQSAKQQRKASPAVLKAIEDAVTESFPAQAFFDRVSAGLRKDFDEKRLQALLKDYSTPTAKRMVELEQAAAPPDEFARFARSAAATRPAPQRASLIKRIDAASRASDLAVDIALAAMKGVASGIAGEGAEKAAAVDKAVEKQRASTTDAIRNATLLNLAFSYRNASDADLEEYAKFYEAENSKWLSGIVYSSLLEESQVASARAGERIGALAGKPASTVAPPARSKAGADARSCLDLTTNRAIMQCAEKYR